MFTGNAERALRLYESILGAEVVFMSKYPAEDEKMAGKVMRASFKLGDTLFTCIDSPVEHQFGFTPSSSMFIEFNSKADMEKAFAYLSIEGKVMMPPANYGFSEWFCWFDDQFGVSWQFNVA